MTNLFMPYGSAYYLGIIAKEGVAKARGAGIAAKPGTQKDVTTVMGEVVRLNAKRR